MTLFLTSSPSGCPFEPGPDIPVLDTRNHFVANLRAVWPDHAVLGLAIAADPYAYEQNDEMCRVFAQSFANAHLPLTALIPCDARNAEEIGSLLPQSGFVMLCGGHVPTQNHFFAQLGLPGLFHNYHGIVLGVSAGSMNAAHIVYAAPEEPGEAADPHYSRWMNGLGLTETRILPHYQFIRDHVLDGIRRHKAGEYCKDLIAKYYPYFPIWVFVNLQFILLTRDVLEISGIAPIKFEISLLYVYDCLMPVNSRKKRYEELQEFLEGRVVRHKEYFRTNTKIVGVYKFQEKVIKNLLTNT